jgi:hypothetical protein
MLRMKTSCQGCRTSLGWQDSAAICSFECTWCPDCAARLEGRCPNCGGELQARPRRERRPLSVAGDLLKRRLGLGSRQAGGRS